MGLKANRTDDRRPPPFRLHVPPPPQGGRRSPASGSSSFAASVTRGLLRGQVWGFSPVENHASSDGRSHAHAHARPRSSPNFPGAASPAQCAGAVPGENTGVVRVSQRRTNAPAQSPARPSSVLSQGALAPSRTRAQRARRAFSAAAPCRLPRPLQRSARRHQGGSAA